jgi:biopolymer transport protein ExbD
MKLDEGIQPEKLSLDMTPLIDIVFLLVLFFALSTSFIRSEDLNALQDQLAKLMQDKETLDSELKDTSGVVVKLESQLLSANDRTRELASTAKTDSNGSATNNPNRIRCCAQRCSKEPRRLKLCRRSYRTLGLGSTPRQTKLPRKRRNNAPFRRGWQRRRRNTRPWNFDSPDRKTRKMP